MINAKKAEKLNYKKLANGIRHILNEVPKYENILPEDCLDEEDINVLSSVESLLCALASQQE